MNKPTNSQEENKKRAAFKRFSQMGIAGLAVSLFSNVSAQDLSLKVETDSLIKQTPSSLDTVNKPSLEEIRWFDANYYNTYHDYSNYCNYNNNYSNNYSNQYSNYSNNYGNYSNNYSNYSNAK